VNRALVGVALLLSTPAAARSVDYAALTPANFAAEAAEFKVAPVSEPPVRSARAVIGEITAAVDHEVLTLGNYCSAYEVYNPMTVLMKQLFAEASHDPATPATLPPIKIIVDAARSNQRCIEIKEYNYRCIARVTITGRGETADSAGTTRSFPLKVSIERDSSVGGFCEGRAQGLAIISREAGQQFVANALAAAAAPSP
jgi:hypothetical protein